MLALLMLPSQRLDPSRNEPYNLIEMCKCVIFFFLWRVDELLSLIYLSSLFFLDVDNLYYYFLHALWACGIPSLGMRLSFFFNMLYEHVAYHLWASIFYFFFICTAHIPDCNFGERERVMV